MSVTVKLRILAMVVIFDLRIVFNVVAQLLEALCYKPEGHGFDSRWSHWNF
jgi:hypothetical protein